MERLTRLVLRHRLVPSAMVLFGRWNWWLPNGLARVLRVEPSPLVSPRAAEGLDLRGR